MSKKESKPVAPVPEVINMVVPMPVTAPSGDIVSWPKDVGATPIPVAVTEDLVMALSLVGAATSPVDPKLLVARARELAAIWALKRGSGNA